MPTSIALRHAADQLERSAGALEPALERPQRMLTPQVWRGAAADRVRSELDEMRGILRAVGGSLHALAAELGRRAGQLDAQAALAERAGARRPS